MRHHHKSKKRRSAVKAGFRSGLELDAANLMTKLGVEWEYESMKLPYKMQTTKRNQCCGNCGSTDIMVETTYTPDFIFHDKNVIYEFKGRWTLTDRKKIIAVQQQNPSWLIVMVFQDPKIKVSKLHSYGSWCDKNNIKWFANSNKSKWIDFIK